MQQTTQEQPINNSATHSLNTAHPTVLSRMSELEQLRKDVKNNIKKIENRKNFLEKVRKKRILKNNFKNFTLLVNKIKKKERLKQFVLEKAIRENFKNPLTNLLVMYSLTDIQQQKNFFKMAKTYYTYRNKISENLRTSFDTRNNLTEKAFINFKSLVNLVDTIKNITKKVATANKDYKKLEVLANGKGHQKRTFTFKDISNKRENLVDVNQVTSNPIINMSTSN